MDGSTYTTINILRFELGARRKRRALQRALALSGTLLAAGIVMAILAF